MKEEEKLLDRMIIELMRQVKMPEKGEH